MADRADAGAELMHEQATALYMKHLLSPAGASEKFQQGLLTGMIFAVSNLFWLGRREGHGAVQIADRIRDIAFDALKQCEDHERAKKN